MHTIKDLQKAYDKAVAENKEVFQIGPFKFVTGYAKYLLMFFEQNHLSSSLKLRDIMTPNEEAFESGDKA